MKERCEHEFFRSAVLGAGWGGGANVNARHIIADNNCSSQATQIHLPF